MIVQKFNFMCVCTFQEDFRKKSRLEGFVGEEVPNENHEELLIIGSLYKNGALKHKVNNLVF